VLKGADGNYYKYCHLEYNSWSDFGISQGSQVRKCTPLARTGNTGFTISGPGGNGTHLHFEVANAKDATVLKDAADIFLCASAMNNPDTTSESLDNSYSLYPGSQSCEFPSLGTLRVVKQYVFNDNLKSIPVSVDGQSYDGQTTDMVHKFDSIPTGNYDIYTILPGSDWEIKYEVRYADGTTITGFPEIIWPGFPPEGPIQAVVRNIRVDYYAKTYFTWFFKPPGGSYQVGPTELPAVGGEPYMVKDLWVNNVPLCSDTSYSNVVTTFKVFNPTSVYYELYVNNSLWWTYSWSYPGDTTLAINIPSLNTDTTYSWRVRVISPQGDSGWVNGPSWNVPLCPPFPPNEVTINAPADGATLSPQVEFSILATDPNINDNLTVYLERWTGSTWVAWDSIGPQKQNTYFRKTKTITSNGETWRAYACDQTNRCGPKSPARGFSIIRENLKYDCGTGGCYFDQNGIQKESFYPGEKITKKFNILREGTGTIPSFWVEIWANPAPGVSPAPPYCNIPNSSAALQIPPTNTISNPVSITFTAPTAPGTYYGMLIIDSRGNSTSTCTVPEHNEGDNFGGNLYEVVAAPPGTEDTDGDGFINADELKIGTDPYDRCAPGVNGGPSPAWPADLKTDGISQNKIDLGNLLTFISPVRRINTASGTPAYDKRWDLVPDGKIDIIDLGKVISFSAPSLSNYPSRAYGGPACIP